MIFISGPYKGSEIASNWIGHIGSRLVHAAAFIADARDAMVSIAMADPAAMPLTRAPNSIDTLAPNDHFFLEINKQLVKRRNSVPLDHRRLRQR